MPELAKAKLNSQTPRAAMPGLPECEWTCRRYTADGLRLAVPSTDASWCSQLSRFGLFDRLELPVLVEKALKRQVIFGPLTAIDHIFITGLLYRQCIDILWSDTEFCRCFTAASGLPCRPRIPKVRQHQFACLSDRLQPCRTRSRSSTHLQVPLGSEPSLIASLLPFRGRRLIVGMGPTVPQAIVAPIQTACQSAGSCPLMWCNHWSPYDLQSRR